MDTPTPNRRSFLKITGSAGAAGMAGLAGCTQDGGDGGAEQSPMPSPDETPSTPTSTQTTTKQQSKEAIRIGQLMPLSGPIGGAGKEMRQGANIRIEQINNAGGISGHPIESFVKDTQASPDTGVKRARQLVQQQDVSILIGIVSSAVAKAVNQFASSQGVPFIDTAAQTPDITKEECAITTFRPTTNIIHQQKTAAATLNEFTSKDATRVAGINPDYVYGHQSWEIFIDEFKQYRSNMEVVSKTWPAFKAGDYKKEIQATLDADPDIVHSVLYSGDLIAFIKQARQFDFFQQDFSFFAGVTPVEVAQPLGETMPNGVLAIANAYPNWPDGYKTMPDPVQAFYKEYQSRYDEVATLLSTGQVAALDALNGAINKSGGITKDDIISGLEGLQFETANPSPVTIRKGDHQGIQDAYFGGVIGNVDYLPFKGFTEMKAFGSDVFADEDECEAF